MISYIDDVIYWCYSNIYILS